MGFILRQSAKFSILNFILVAIGALSVLFIYPANLKLYGELNLLYFSANLITPLVSLGFANAILKNHQRFTNLGYEQNYLSFSILGSVIMATIGLVTFLLLKNVILKLFIIFNVPIEFIQANYNLIGILSFILVLNSSLIYYSSIQKRIVVPELISNGGYKLFVPVLILISTFYSFSTEAFFYANIAFFILVFFLILGYCYSLKFNSWDPKFSIFTYYEHWHTFIFVILSAINNFFYHLIFRVDIIIVGIYLSPEIAGAYSILIFIASLLEIPNKSLTQITTPLVSKFVAEGNWQELKKLYADTSQNLFLLGSFIYFLIIYNVVYISDFIPKLEFGQQHLLAIVFIGLSRLIDMTFSLNSQIILFSNKYYIYNLITILFGAINIVLSQYCIVHFGLVGIAASVLTSIALFNLFKSLYIWKVMKMNPMDRKMVLVFIFISGLHILWIFIPKIDNAFLGIFFHLSLVTLAYFIFLYKFKPSSTINDILLNFINKFKMQ